MLRKFNLFEILIYNLMVVIVFSYFIHSHLISLGVLYELISVGFIVVLIFYQTYMVFTRKKVFSLIYFILSFMVLFYSLKSGGVNGYFLTQADGNSSCPTICNGDYIMVNPKVLNLQRGSFILFKRDDGRLYSKRVHGIPGDAINICNTAVYINEYQYSLENSWSGQAKDNDRCSSRNESLVLGKDEYFVMGDNLRGSVDSRHFGPIKISDIHGELLYKYGPNYGVESIFVGVRFGQ